MGNETKIMVKERKPSRLQRNILIVLASLSQKQPGPVLSTDIEKILRAGADEPVYRPNLQSSCRRLESAGYVRMLRGSRNLRLSVELTEAGKAFAAPLLKKEYEEELNRQRNSDIRVLPVRTESIKEAVQIELNGVRYTAYRAVFVVRLNGGTCLEIWQGNGPVIKLEGDALQIAIWYQKCFDHGLEVRIQVNESQSSKQ